MKILKNTLKILLFSILVSVIITVFSACGGGKNGGSGDGGTGESEKFEDKSDIYIVSEETFNSEIKNKSKTDFKFSPEKIFEKREKSLLSEKKYYALFYVKDTVIKEASISVGFLNNGTLDDEVFVGTSKGKLTGERLGLHSATVTRDGKAVKADIYVAVCFKIEELSSAYNSYSLKMYFWGYSEYDYSEDGRNSSDVRVEKEFNIFHDKQIKASSSIKYLTENDYKSGSYEDKLKDTVENAPIGEKIYAVIDYKLSGAKLIEETDMLTLSLEAKWKDGEKFTLSVEEFPTADYEQYGNTVTASFKIYGAVSQEKLFRFIVSVVTDSAGNLSISAELSGEKISVTEGESVSGTVGISTDAVSESYLEYTLSSDGKYYIITGIGNERREVIEIPEKYNDIPVREIGENVFANLAYVKKVELTDLITKIGANAFRGCIGLESIIIPSYVTVIEDNAFADCPETGIYCKAERLPDTWSKSWAPSDAYVLWNYSWMFFVKNDSGYSFAQNGSGENVAVPREYNGMPVTQINGISQFAKKVKIPDTVKLISSDAFKGCTYLKQIIIPDSVEVIHQYAFYGCTSLNKVTFGENSKLKTISKNAFMSCPSLTSFTLPKNVTSIGEYAFEGDEKLVEVINKSSLTLTAGEETNGCIAKYAFKIHSGVSEIVNKDGYLFYTHSGKIYILGYVGKDIALTLPSTYNGAAYEIYKYAFYKNPEITAVTIPSGVTGIGEYAFYICPLLTDVTVSEDVEAIGEYAFYTCKTLKNLNIAENGRLKNIGTYAFYGCQKLAAISLPDSVRNIGSVAFTDTSYYNNTSNWENGLLYIGKHLIKANSSDIGDFVTVKDGTLSIASGAMSGCYRVISVVIPESVKFIGTSAFSSCNKLIEVIDKSSLGITETSYGLKAFEVHSGESKTVENDGFIFYSLSGENYLLGYKGDKTELTLPADFNGESYEIYQYAFYKRAEITSVIIPNNVTAIGSNAFDYCSGLTEIIIPDSVISIGAYAFRSCEALTKVTVGTGVTNIGRDAFWTCPSLTGVYIKDIAKWCVIEFADSGSNPLYHAKNLYLNDVLLTELVIPGGITHISSYAFYQCTSLQYVYIPESVVSIGDYAFRYCTGIVRYVYQGTETQWNEITKGSYWHSDRLNITYNGMGNW